MSRTVDPEILLGFLEEASGYLPAVRTGIAALRDNPADLAAAEEAHRGVHTIKGAAAMVGLNGLSHIAQHFEEAFDDILGGRIALEPSVFPILDRAVGHIEEYLEATLGENLDEDKLVADAVEGLRAIRGLPVGASAATGAALGGGPGWVLPFEVEEPNLDDTVDDFAGLGLPSFGDPEDAIDEADRLPPPAFAAPVPNDVSPELLEVFKLEADDHLRALTTLLPGTKANPADRDQWTEIRRAAHTLKGTAAMVGFADVTKLAHRMEDLLDLYFEGARIATSVEIDLLLNGTDAIEDTINGRPAAFAPLYAKLDAALASNAPAAPAPELPVPAMPEIADDEPTERIEAKSTRAEAGEAFVRVPIERLNDIVKLVGELVIARTAFEARMGDFQKLLNELDPSTTRLRRASAKLDTGFEALALGGDSTAAPADGFDSLELDRYTEFHLVSRELAETTNDIQTLAGELGHVHGDCDGFLTRQARLASELEDKLMRLRMVPLSTTATKLQRTVRNAAEQTRKKAELVLEGERTGLDKTVLEAMADPLLHLLRNAVDHGLETPEVRRALGKPEVGTIRLAATHEGNQVVLRIADDGRGIDAHAVRETAIARGIDAHELPLDDVYGLLFAPGFSTKGEVSELSGRGVGLDVVKSKVEALKGTVSVASKVGKGTTFTIRLPLTLAVTRALLVQSNGQTFAVPLDCVEQILRFEESDVQRVGREPFLRVGDATYPVAHLGRVLELKTPADDAVKRPPVLLVRSGEKRLAIVVEHLIGGREIVIKNLGPHLRKVPAVTGATLLGDGSVVLILNPPELVRAAATRAAMEMSMLMPRSVPKRTRTATTVLLVDDSPSVRRVLATLAERQGWKPIAAKDGVEALEILQRGQALPDIVLSDVEMPRMDGFELLGSIRGQTSLARLPVVMITSRAAEKHRRKAMDLGASAYVTKPYQDESLVDVIRHLTRSTA